MKSYCSISQCWSTNQLHREALITKQASIPPTSLSPLRSPGKSDTKENGEWIMCRIDTRVCHKCYHLEWKLRLHCASAGILSLPSPFYTCLACPVTTSWIKWHLPTLSSIAQTRHVLTFPCNIIITKSSGKSKQIIHLFPSGAQRQCLIWRFLLLSNWASQMFFWNSERKVNLVSTEQGFLAWQRLLQVTKEEEKIDSSQQNILLFKNISPTWKAVLEKQRHCCFSRFPVISR